MSPIDEYLNNNTSLPQQKALDHIRKTAHSTISGLEESISYGIPTLKLSGKNLIHFAAFKDHMSLFPGSGPIEGLASKLTKFKLSKGTIQFTEQNPLTDKLLKEIIKLRASGILKSTNRK